MRFAPPCRLALVLLLIGWGPALAGESAGFSLLAEILDEADESVPWTGRASVLSFSRLCPLGQDDGWEVKPYSFPGEEPSPGAASPSVAAAPLRISRAFGLSFALPGMGHMLFGSNSAKVVGAAHITFDVGVIALMLGGMFLSSRQSNESDAFWGTFAYSFLGLATLALHRIECSLETLLYGLLLRRVRALKKWSWMRQDKPHPESRPLRVQVGLYWPCHARPLLGAPGSAPETSVAGGGFDLGLEVDLSRGVPLFARIDLRCEGGTQGGRITLVPGGFTGAATRVAHLTSLGLGFGVGRIVYAFVRPAISQEHVRLEGSYWIVGSLKMGYCLGLGWGIRCTRGTAIEFVANLNLPSEPHELTYRFPQCGSAGSSSRSLYFSMGFKGSF